jgi:stage II sporulation protein D
MSAVAVSSAADASAARTDFTFYGSGFGHGIGMSQWGAYGMASQGLTHGQILRHFYSGTRVVSNLQLPSRVRVGLVWGVRTVHLTAASGTVRIWIGTPLNGTAVGTIPAGQTWSVSSASNGAYKIRDQSGERVGGRSWGSSLQNVYATYQDSGSRLSVGETGFSYARGYLEFNTYSCTDRCFERLILKIPFEQYLMGIGEVPSSWPAEALAAQVVASRTYAAYEVRRYGRRPGCNCHVQAGGNDQNYVGWSKESGLDGANWVAAVSATSGQVVTYQGALIQAFFTASDGGHTESVENAWHGGDPAYAIPYLKGVCDPGENTPANPWISWNYTFTWTDATGRLGPYTGPIGTITGFGTATRGVSGRIITIPVAGTSGSASVTGSDLRAAFGLPDDRLWVNNDRNIVGPIRTAYDGLGCSPGLPTSQIQVLPAGSRMRFMSGGLYRNDQAGATFLLTGAVYGQYKAAGEMTGSLGLPTSDVVLAKDGSTSATFEHGKITCDPAGVCTVS